MNSEISYEEAIKLKNPLFIDLRSENEFENGTIFGSINLPILNNDERKIVGTEYTKGSVDLAKEKAVIYASSRLKKIFDFIMKNCHKYNIILYCSRGGYRSKALYFLLLSLDIKVYRLKNGYKEYRNVVLDFFNNSLNKFEFINLTGYTGTGKTEILNILEKKERQVLNFEKIASHRGSSLGHIGLNTQPSQKNFETLLYEKLSSFQEKYVFTEDESIRIGKLFIPENLYKCYSSSNHQILINCSMNDRVSRIKNDYLDKNNKTLKNDILDGLKSLSKYISNDRINEYKKALDEDNYDKIIKELIEKYYDYNYAISKKNYEMILENDNSEKLANLLIKKYISKTKYQ